MHTKSGAISWTMTLNGVFIVLWLIVQVANAFGFANFTPPTEWAAIVAAIVAVINLALRYFRTSEPISR